MPGELHILQDGQVLQEPVSLGDVSYPAVPQVGAFPVGESGDVIPIQEDMPGCWLQHTRGYVQQLLRPRIQGWSGLR